MFEKILEAYQLKPAHYSVKPMGSGLINHTYIVHNLYNEPAFVLQQINTQVFKDPQVIADNTSLIEKFLQQHHPDYLFIAPLKTISGSEMFLTDEGAYYRLSSYLWDSYTAEVVETPQQAFEAAQQFGRFTRLLSGIDIEKLQLTLPGFHDLSFRFEQFNKAVNKASAERKESAGDLILFMHDHKEIIETYKNILLDPGFKKRVTHHDTKISNVLFKKDHAVCVIDLDTVMPGYFISDAGDMMRTYLSPVSEEEKDLSKIQCRDEFFEAIARGYLGEMKEELSVTEIDHFVFAGKFMIYMQAIRFLTDYLDNDTYYKTSYQGQNLVRAKNQVMLLQRLIEKEAPYRLLVKQVIEA